jgi:hypothetical protein
MVVMTWLRNTVFATLRSLFAMRIKTALERRPKPLSKCWLKPTVKVVGIEGLYNALVEVVLFRWPLTAATKLVPVKKPFPKKVP